MRYRSFVESAEDGYEHARVPGTPTAEIDDARIPDECNSLLFSGKAFDQLLSEIRKHPEIRRPASG